MTNIFKKIRDEKKEYRLQMEKVKLLPESYQFVFHKIQAYMWQFSGGSGLDMLKTQYELIELFQEGTAQGKHVLEITGKDVASFANELIRDNRQWTDYYRKKLNHAMMKTSETTH